MNSIDFVAITSIILFFIGLYGLIARSNIIKSILSISIMEIGVILYFLGANFNMNNVPPVGDLKNTPVEKIADPLPQALMITEVVIGIAITAVSLSMFIAMYHRYGTTSWKIAKENRLKDD